MAKVTTTDKIVVDRDYTDSYSIKDTALATLGQKYFGDIPLSALNVGEQGFVMEQIANITEDAMNTASVLINEAFPNKAIIPESIYSHAAIFQLDNSFGSAATCTFVLLLQQEDILLYGSQDSSNGTVVFKIDKDMIINVEDISFTLDYDVVIEAKKKNIAGTYQSEYVYSAKYDMAIPNSVSNVTNPYLKMRKVNNGLLMLELTARQVTRTELHEQIITNTKINYPVLDFEFDDTLAGFDIFYKAPTASDYTRLDKLVKFSLPLKTPFCYYRLKDENILEISFSPKDGYFQPEFNSDIKVITYTTTGEEANFEEYTGRSITFQPYSENYAYNSKMIIAGKAVSPAAGGASKLSIDALQALTVEGFSTANELSTENDISTYFYNYKYRYGNEIFVIKRRDDIMERLFSAFLLIKRDDYIYPTNTLGANINSFEFDRSENGNVYTLNPGHLFVYEGNSRNRVRLLPGYMSYDKTITDHLYKDRYETPSIWFSDQIIVFDNSKKEDPTTWNTTFFVKNREGYWQHYDADGNIIEYNEYTDDDMTSKTELLGLKKKTVCYREETITTKHYVDNESGTYYLSDGKHYDANGNKIDGDLSTDTLTTMIENGMLALSVESHQVYYESDTTGKKTGDYIGYEKLMKDINIYKLSNLGEYYVQDLNGYSRYNWSGEKLETRIDMEDLKPLILSGGVEFKQGYQFIYTNPFLISMSKSPNLVGLYKNIQNEIVSLDYVSSNDNLLCQFITSKLKLNRRLEENSRYEISLSIIPSTVLDGDYVHEFGNYKSATGILNDVRIFASFLNGDEEVGYIELFPSEVDASDKSMVTFSAKIITNDYITTDKMFAILNLVSAESVDYHYVPIENCSVNVYICYRDNIGAVQPGFFDLFRPKDDHGNSVPGGDIDLYSLANVYSAKTEGLTFVEPLNMMRSNVTFYTGPLDTEGNEMCTIAAMSLLPMVKADMVNSTDTFNTFISKVTDNYRYLEECSPRLRNNTNLDIKFYNTYGRSNNYYIGDEQELIDRVNISISYDVKLVDGTTATNVMAELQAFIKSFVEKVNSSGSNDLYISNMIKAIENNFPAVHHLRFTGINDYDPKYQTVCMKVTDLNDLTKEELREYVPEVLVVAQDDIKLNVEVVKTIS